MQQAEALVRITNKLESLETDLRDTQELIGALHGKMMSRLQKIARQKEYRTGSDQIWHGMYAGATAKQLQLVMQALQLSQAAKALAQTVAAAVEKDREAGMGLPQVAAAMMIVKLCCSFASLCLLRTSRL